MTLEQPVQVNPGPAAVLGSLPAKVRRAIYVVHGLLALAAISALVGYASINHTIPSWLVAANAVLVSLITPVNGLATANVVKTVGEGSS